MVIDLNARHFDGKPVVTCFTCHNGKLHPALMPPLPTPVPPETKPAAVTTAKAQYWFDAESGFLLRRVPDAD